MIGYTAQFLEVDRSLRAFAKGFSVHCLECGVGCQAFPSVGAPQVDITRIERAFVSGDRRVQMVLILRRYLLILKSVNWGNTMKEEKPDEMTLAYDVSHIEFHDARVGRPVR